MRPDHKGNKKGKIFQKLDFLFQNDYNYRKEVGKLWGYGFGFLLFGL
jgi:hypothetical protein